MKEKQPKDLSWQKECRYAPVFNIKELDYFPVGDFIACDIETTGLDTTRDNIVGISFSSLSGTSAYCPIQHNCFANNSRESVLSYINRWAENRTFIFFNQKFDLAFLEKAGAKIPKTADAQIYLYNAYAHLFEQGASLKKLAKKLLGLDMMELHELFGMPKATFERSGKTFAELPVDDKTLSYVCADADITLRLWNLVQAEIKKNPNAEKLLSLDHKVLKPIKRMETTGILIDKPYFEELNQLIEDEKIKLRAAFTEKTKIPYKTDIYEVERIGEHLVIGVPNVNSPKQLREYFFGKLGLKPLVFTEKGEPSTSQRAITALNRRYRKKYPELSWLSEYRKLDILQRSFLNPILKGINPNDGRIYPNFKSASLVSGRIASTGDGVYLKKLNFQGIPKNLVEGGFNIRKGFVASPGYTWVSIDMANMEPRLIAQFSQDPALVEFFNSGDGDLHSRTCELVFRIGRDTPDFKRYRKIAKILNLNMAYAFGITSLRAKLEEELGKPVSEKYCWELYDFFYEKAYPTWQAYRKKCIAKARNSGFAETYYGRRRKVSDYYKEHDYFGCHGDRIAVNHPIQGTGADLLRIALVRLDEFIGSLPSDAVRMLSTVHDEINFEIRDSYVSDVIPKIKEITGFTPKGWNVPVQTTIESGRSWGELHSYA